MKSIQRTLTLLSLTVLLFAGAARSQTTVLLLRVKVPFEFQVRNTILPAGDYTVVRATADILTLRDSRGNVVASAVTMPAQTLTAPRASKLIFRVDGRRNVLLGVWTSNSRYGYEFPVPRMATAFANRPAPVQTAAGR